MIGKQELGYRHKYLKEAIGFSNEMKSLSGIVAWESPSNIALIKYWGKKKGQLPMNPSLSLTLSKSVTLTQVEYFFTGENYRPVVDYVFAGRKNPDFSGRIESWLDSLTPYYPFLRNLELKINSENTFPHSSGIASSASAFSALALGLVEIEQRIKNDSETDDDFFRKASFMARLGSGSACRSVYGSWVLWGNTPSVLGSSDEFALPVDTLVHPSLANMGDSILIVDDTVKSVSSSAGHSMMKENPYAKIRFRQARSNLDNLLSILSSGDIAGFFDQTEHEALSLHAMMMTSYPGYMLLKPRSLEMMNKIGQKRKTGLPIGFTIDAGANIHLLYPPSHKDEVGAFIQNELVTDSHIKIIKDFVGKGPVRMEK